MGICLICCLLLRKRPKIVIRQSNILRCYNLCKSDLRCFKAAFLKYETYCIFITMRPSYSGKSHFSGCQSKCSYIQVAVRIGKHRRIYTPGKRLGAAKGICPQPELPRIDNFADMEKNKKTGRPCLEAGIARMTCF